MSTLISPGSIAARAMPKAKRGTYYVQTWGCQMNEEDSEQLALRLESIGFVPAEGILDAHVILLNTCSVRKKPEDKAFSMLGELAMLKARRPEVIIGVCGCMAQIRSDEIRRRAPHVDFVVGTAQIESVPGLVEEVAQLRKFQTRLDLPERKGAVVENVPQRLFGAVEGQMDQGTEGRGEGPRSEVRGRDEEGRRDGGTEEPEEGLGAGVWGLEEKGQRDGGTVGLGLGISHSEIRNPQSIRSDWLANRHPQASKRTGSKKLKAFVPIQYGCDKFCTFCIVPTTRGRERSRPAEHIVAEVRTLAAQGTKEITLLGQTVNSYGKNLAEGRVPFSKLLWLLEGIPGLVRIRYTSPYPRDFKEDLVSCIRDNPKVMEHVHLPLQSGDDEVLQAMKRVYSVEGFLEIVASLREAVPTIGITTDIIVGFPGETEEQFERTLEIVREVRFDGAFMFAYSPRPGTPASKMPQVPAADKRTRLHELVALQTEITVQQNSAWIGKTMEVLVEGPSPKNPNLLQGYSREFKMVHFEGPQSWKGDLVQVVGVEAHLWGLTGKAA
ncbi:MAG: MiaB/RimO family radical SAM methylthiotransferase [Armatimonadetes bacterium]|nr:MiaB/RimO family radical SAM methylthiotransferase [Armatimonadota bacterium]